MGAQTTRSRLEGIDQQVNYQRNHFSDMGVDNYAYRLVALKTYWPAVEEYWFRCGFYVKQQVEQDCLTEGGLS